MSLESKVLSERNNELFGKSKSNNVHEDDNNGSNQDVKEIPIVDEVVKEFCSKIYSTTQGFRKGLSIVKPYDQIFFTGYVENYHQKIQDFEIFEDDVWISTYPRSG